MKPNFVRSAAALAALAILVSACAAPAAPAPAAPAAPAATEASAATEAPAATEVPAATEAPAATEPPAATEAAAATEAPVAATGDFTVGMVLVGPMNDKGWNEAHVEGSKWVMDNNPNVKFEYVDKVNPGDRPNVKGSQVADELIAKGAKFIIFNSDDFKDDALETAKKHPDIPVIHASGDYAWKEGKNFKDQPNLGNIMMQMEWGQHISGCAAALSAPNGKIGVLGPLINEETRRYASSAYLGAKYCWENVLKKDPKDLTFKVTWIGFWFNIPGVTLDPTKVADDFYNGGFDVVMSQIDTQEAAVQGKKAAEAGKPVKYVHYDYRQGCEMAPDICIGVAYYNWGPSYAKQIQNAIDGKFTSEWEWVAPDWANFNEPDAPGIGFLKGPALGDNAAAIDEFIKGLSDGSIVLWQGPLNLQDGTAYLPDGQKATEQEIWYLPQLVEGMEGASQ